MADEIVSVLGFDVSQALTALEQIDQKTSAWEDSLGRLGKALSAIDGSKLEALSAVAGKIGEANQQTRNLGLSWGSVEKIVASRLISQGIYEIKDLISESVSEAMKLETAMAKLHTFTGVDSSSLQASVKGVSESLALSLDETTKGIGQAFRANVGGASESLQLFHESALLAKATLSDQLGPTVDTVGGIIKGWGLSVGDSAAVASKLLTVSQDSRTDVDELGATFGRTAPLARALGISFDETAASVIALVNAGQSSSQALSTVERTTRSLAKPNKDLSAALHELGFANSEAAIQTLGWGGTLQALSKTTSGAASDLMKLGASGRGANAIFSIGTTSAQAYADALAKVQGTASNYAATSAAAVLNTSSEKLAAGLQKLKDSLLDVGSDIVGALAKVSGAVDVVSGALKGIGDTAIAAAPMALAYGLNWATGLTAAAAAGSSFAKVLTGLTSTAGLGVLAVAGGLLIGREIERSAEQWREALDATGQRELEHFRAAQAEKLSAESQSNAKRVAEALRANVGISQAYTAELAAATATGNSVEREITQRLNRQASVYQKYADSIVRAEEKAQSEIVASHARAEKLADTRNEIVFRQGLGDKTPQDQVTALMTQGNRAAQEAQSVLDRGARTGDDKAIARAQQLFATADAYEREAAAQAKGLGLADQQTTAEALRLKIVDDHLRAEDALARAEQQRMTALAAQRSVEQERADKAKEYAQIIAESSKVKDAQGNPKPQADLDRMAAARNKAFAGLNALAFDGGDTATAKKLGTLKELTAATVSQPQDLQLSVEKSLADVRGKIDRAFATYRAHLSIDVGGLERLTGAPINNQQGLIAQETSLRAEYDRLSAAQSKARDEAGKAISVTRTELGALASTGSSAFQGFLTTILETPPAIKTLDTAVAKVRSDFVETGSSGEITADAIKKIAGEVQLLDQYSHAGLFGNAGLKLFVQDSTAAIQKLQEIRDLQQKMKSSDALSPANTERLQAIKQWLDALPVNKLDGGAAAAARTADSAAQIDAHYQSAASAAERLDALVDQQQQPADHAAGGSIYFASGGTPRGTDTIPAMLSPGEMVINAKSARNFGAQLTAMNAGVQPAYHDHGGNVTNSNNTTVGDVYVSGGDTPRQTGRAIASEIRRELRRGSSSLS